MVYPIRVFLLILGLVGVALAQAGTAGQPVPVDRIVAVVNDEVITQYDLRGRLDSALAQLKRQGMTPPPADVLERQVLERLVFDKVQLQLAREAGLRVDDAQLEQALQRIATANNMSLAQFRAALEKDGVTFASFREEIRSEMIIARLREREVDSKIFISDGEIDNYLTLVAGQGSAGEEYRLAHILLRAPESANPDQIQKLRGKAEQILERLRKGEDFAQLAAAYSDAPDGMRGGDLGWRPADRLPSLFAEAGQKLKVGEVSPILRSSNGFHLVKLLGKRGGAAGAQAVEQTHARHILIKVNELVSESEARHKVEGLRERIRHGESFAELAKLFSQDASAAKGGDLGWIYPGDTVPEFETAMNQLAPGELSQPVQSPFGYHLIEVIERRVQDVSNERQRAAARQTLRERKRDEAYQDWLRQARDRAYVELRLDER
ncbi:peptidylprolyl isomerase [Accumulibacter sp.]|uniref:peptidylprolyl isomerase n=1 Tax=Accumulibacter sp. TaxID=2053492 RepID=UPI0025CE169C|nr:peptidylprolyl isomerase [Accumulibacter sp.]MCM8595428.1 peptidylprolyl isomerase [Accumulibacter sp.]MCM8626391.1 peptidylprolyl isomerase [Accumulibacter sp.]MDS4049575.1 peptidylprolyl isomerase [Accumulibacter sp.]